MVDSDAKLRLEYDDVSSKLLARKSTVHFAHAAIFGLIGLIASGTSAKLFWDFGVADYRLETTVSTVVASLGLVYALARFALGRRELKLELSLLERLRSLRVALHLDDPKALLPS